jgi:hypothetical protein
MRLAPTIIKYLRSNLGVQKVDGIVLSSGTSPSVDLGSRGTDGLYHGFPPGLASQRSRLSDISENSQQLQASALPTI